MARMGLSVLLSSPVSAVPSGADLGGGGGRGHCTPSLQQARNITCTRDAFARATTPHARHGSLAADNKQHVDQGDRRQIDSKRFEYP